MLNMWNPFVLFQQLVLMLLVKELTFQDKVYMWLALGKQYAYDRYMQAWITFQEVFFINVLPSVNLMVVVGYGIYRLANYLKGRHRTPYQEVVQETKQASTNVVHVHNALQLGTETRSNHSAGFTRNFEKYIEGTDLSVWFSLLEFHLKKQGVIG